MTLRIAVDARPLSPPVTGIGSYLGSLMERLVGSGHRWFLYSDRPLSPLPWMDAGSVRLRHCDAPRQSLASLKIANLDFARWAKADGVDIFWSPRHHLPLGLSRTTPCAVTVHDLVWRRLPHTLPWRNLLVERLFMASALRRARSIIAVSEFTASEIRHFYPAATSRCVVIPEAGRELPRSPETEQQAPYFLFVGTAEPRKNLPRLLKAFAAFLAESGLPYRLVIVGDAGWGELNLAGLSEKLGISANVDFAGFVSNERLAGLYASALALVLPSLYEGFGLPVVEAMQFATPVIVSNRGALPEVTGAGGLLVDPDSTQDIADALQRLATEANLRKQLSRAAALQGERFSWQAAATATLQTLEACA